MRAAYLPVGRPCARLRRKCSCRDCLPFRDVQTLASHGQAGPLLRPIVGTVFRLIPSRLLKRPIVGTVSATRTGLLY